MFPPRNCSARLAQVLPAMTLPIADGSKWIAPATIDLIAPAISSGDSGVTRRAISGLSNELANPLIRDAMMGVP
jgi:hypothetical protein